LTNWAEKPRRGQRANDRGGLGGAPALGGTFWPREVRRGRRYKQLRGFKLARHLGAKGIEVLDLRWSAQSAGGEARGATSRRATPQTPTAPRGRVLAGEASWVPKSGDGRVEMIRALRAARRCAIKART
jgi:hypothetical protein